MPSNRLYSSSPVSFGVVGVPNWISVERSWDDREGVVDPKSKAGVRKTLLGETLRLILIDHVRRTGRSGDELLFGKTVSEPFVPWTVGKHADDAWTAADLHRVTLHQCRHGFDSFLDAAGIARPAQIGTWATHRTPSAIATGIGFAGSSPRMRGGLRGTCTVTLPKSSRSRLAHRLARKRRELLR
jgi:hypothetical protein